MTRTITIPIADLQAQLDAINSGAGHVIAVFVHPYVTDGRGAQIVIIWEE